MEFTHKQLVEIGYKWCLSRCGFAFKELVTIGGYGEIPDVIGFNSMGTFILEAKTSRSDFLSDKNKCFRKRPEWGMGDWRFYICPPEIIQVSDLPKGWGLLWVTPKTVRKMHGVPPNTNWHRLKPFDGNKLNETRLLTSAMRRFAVRGLLETVYLPIGETL